MKVFSLFFLLFVCLTVTQTFAATFTVNQTGDAGDLTCDATCTLRDAIDDANAIATNDTVIFAIPEGDAGCTGGVCTIILTLGELAVADSATAGILTLTNSTGASNLLISGNNASRVFYLFFRAYLRLNGVTITKGNGRGFTFQGLNGYGGGIFVNNNGSLALINSTVSGNTASSHGGISNGFESTLNLRSVTVTQNSSTSTTCTICAGGIRNIGTVNLNNTIVAGNTAANAATSPDFQGVVAAGSAYNLIGNGLGMDGITNGDANSNQVGVDPLLDPTLQFNGGTTLTHALLAGSPALDKGNSFGITTDQREFARPVDLATYPNAINGDGSDIGAFEAQFAPAEPTAATVAISGRVTATDGSGIAGVLISIIDSEGNTRTVLTSSTGDYRFEDAIAGETYILNAASSQYSFSQSAQVVSATSEINGVNFIVSVSVKSRKRVRIFLTNRTNKTKKP